MNCVLCRREIQDDEPSVKLPDSWGGGFAHKDHWDALIPYAKRLCREVPADKTGG